MRKLFRAIYGLRTSLLVPVAWERPLLGDPLALSDAGNMIAAG